jgi:hypothetical protein
MGKDDYVTEVIFRKEKDGDILALFPHEIDTLIGDIWCYAHVGQHSGADYDYCIQKSKPAKANEYQYLKEELESLGYNLKVIKRRNYNKYLTELKKVRQ